MFLWLKRAAALARARLRAAPRRHADEIQIADPAADKAAIRRALAARLSPHLIRDVGGED
jgi:hypothetical protein